MRLIGAALLSTSAFIIGLLKARELNNSVSRLRELTALLELMKNEICTRRTPLRSIISRAERMGFVYVDGFVARLSDRLCELGELSFGELWAECIEETLCFLPQNQRSELINVGHSIGRYDAQLQAEGLERCIYVFERELDMKTASLASGQKMYISLALSAGLIVSIILI